MKKDIIALVQLCPLKIERKMKSVKNLFLLVVTTIVISLSLVITPFTVTANSADFSVKAILPENQRTANLSYFDLKLAPKEDTTLQVEIENHSDVTKSYEILLNAATTNMNGVINYGEPSEAEERDSSLKISFDEIAKVESLITIEARAKKIISIQVVMPNEVIEGVILGGITVFEAEEENTQTEQQITNRFSYSIGVLLSQNEERPDFDLNFKGVNVVQENKRNMISAHIQNTSSRIINGLSLDTRIYRKNQENPLFHREASELRMAPNSNFNFGVETNNQPLRAGRYTMVTKAQVQDETWEWSEEFEISVEQARELNSTAVDLEKNQIKVYFYIALGVIILLVALLVSAIVVWKRSKGQK